MKKINWFLAMLFASNVGLSQENEDTLSVDVSTVEVVKQATALASESLRIVTVLSKQDIAAMPVQSVNDLLDYVPGIDVRSRGTDGVQADLSMRGGTFDQVIVLLNGVNVTDPQTGHQNLDIPIDLSVVDRIEILQGTSMNVFGLSAFSGAINIITGGKTDNSVDVGVTGGSNGYVAPHIGLSAHTEKLTATASVSHKQSSGYIDNTDFNYSNAFLHLEYRDSTLGTYSFQLGGQIKKFGANSFYSVNYPNQYEQDNTLISSLQWRKSFGRNDFSSSIFYRAHYQEFELFRNKENAPAWYGNHNYHISQLYGGNVKYALYSKVGKTTVGVELRDERIVSNVLGDALSTPKRVPMSPPEDSIFFIYGKNRMNVNCFGEQTFVFGKFTSSLGFSGNYNSMFHTNVCWGANVGYRVSTKIRLYANANSALRLPTFTDMYYKSATQLANPNLRPEKSTTFEIGTQLQSNSLSGRVSGYYRIGTDIIDWARTADEEVWNSMNIDNVNAFGSELSMKYNWNTIVKTVGVSYSFCRLNKESGTLISKYALDYLRNTLTISLNHTIYKRVCANWQYTWRDRVGTYVGADGATTEYNPFSLLDVQVYWNNGTTNVFVEVSNLFNTQYYDYGGVEQPGMQVRVGLNVHFAR